MSYSLTILTPLYNRPEFIDKLYECLCSQTDKDFQWLVIDDGSRERSDEKFENLAAVSPFAVEYHYKENGGKHTALNYSHQFIKSEYVLILDSDDTLTPDAVETVKIFTAKYGDDKSVGIISFQRGTDTKHPLVEYECDEEVSDHITYRINGNRPGDSCEVLRTDVLKEYPFPVFPGERFLVESHLWISSAYRYKTVYIKKVIYLNDYQDGGLTDCGHGMRRTCPLGGMYTQKLGLDSRFSLKYRIKRAILLTYYGKLAGKSAGEILKYSGHPVLVGAMMIPANILLLIKNRKYK